MGKLIFGGSFNPLHIGHMRMAIGAGEILGSLTDSTDFVPVAHPPHKNEHDLLPFAMRVRMIRETLRNFSAMNCNTLEENVAGLSFTCNTLFRYHEFFPEEEFYFLIGSMDYESLPTWNNWRQIIQLANLAVAPRGNFLKDDFIRFTSSLWPGAVVDREWRGSLKTEGDSALCMQVPGANKIYYLPLPVLEISASQIRNLWLEGLSIDFLVPTKILDFLRNNEETVRKYWRENQGLCSMCLQKN